MPRKRPVTVSVSPDKCFVKELAGETPPSFESMLTLYEVSSQLFGLRPWRILEEDNLIVVRDSVSGELCFCSVMGAAGEVYSMHAYIGTPGLRLFSRYATGRSPVPANSSQSRIASTSSSCPKPNC